MNPIITALLIGLPSTVLGFLLYRQSRKKDAVAAQSGVVTETRAGVAQIIEGQNALIKNLQEDNRSVREEVRLLTLNFNQNREELRREVEGLKGEVAWLRKKYGESNGIEPSTSKG